MAKISRRFVEEVAAARSDAALKQLLRSHGVIADELDPRLPAELRLKLENAGAYGAPLAQWREEQQALSSASDFLKHAARILGAREREKKGPYPAPKGSPQFDKQSFADWRAAADEESQRVGLIIAIQTRINAGLSRTVTLELSSDLKSMKARARNMMGSAWLQLADAASALAKQRPAKKCGRDGCGVTFTPKRITAKFCSAACRAGAWTPKP